MLIGAGTVEEGGKERAGGRREGELCRESTTVLKRSTRNSLSHGAGERYKVVWRETVQQTDQSWILATRPWIALVQTA